MWLIAVIFGVLALEIVFRLVADGWNRKRICSFIATEGGQVQSIIWKARWRGLLAHWHPGIYDVCYIDADQKRHQATCRTHMLGRVWWLEDCVIEGRP